MVKDLEPELLRHLAQGTASLLIATKGSPRGELRGQVNEQCGHNKVQRPASAMCLCTCHLVSQHPVRRVKPYKASKGAGSPQPWPCSSVIAVANCSHLELQHSRVRAVAGDARGCLEHTAPPPASASRYISPTSVRWGPSTLLRPGQRGCGCLRLWMQPPDL